MSSFAPITEEFEARFARVLSPAAKSLWIWLRRKAPPETEIEIDLNEFAATFNYSLKWVRTALKSLIEHDLVEEIRRYFHQGFRLKVHQVGELGKKSSPSVPTTSTSRLQTSKRAPSNADDFVTNNRDKSIDQQDPTAHPVSENEQERTIGAQSGLSKPDRIGILEQIERLGVQVNRNLLRVIEGADPIAVSHAIAALREQLKQNNPIRNRGGFLRSAIQRGFTPNHQRSQRQNQSEATTMAEVLHTVAARLVQPSPSVVLSAEDLSDTIAEITLHLDRLQWSKVQVRAILQYQFGQPQQSYLSSEQLRQWLNYLKLQI